MTNIINQLRVYAGFSGYDTDDKVQEIDDLLYSNKVEEMGSTFREGGRWSNYETTVYKVTENGETAYFEIDKEVPATKMQEGGDNSFGFNEVKPVKKTITVYVPV